MNYKEQLESKLDEQRCPECGAKNIGVDNWGMFPGQNDWFYFCKECDLTFGGNYDDWFIKEMDDRFGEMFKDSVHVKVND